MGVAGWLRAALAASSSATAWRRAGLLLLRHGQAARPPLRPPLPGAKPAASPPPPGPGPGHADRRLLRGSATARPRAGRRLLPHGRLLPLPPRRPQAAGSRIAAEEGSAPPVVGAQSGPMGLMGRRALQCLGPGQHSTRGISAVPGPPPRTGGPTWPGTEVDRACIVPGRVGPGQLGLGPGGPFEHL
jgi:hypothetical protein